MANHELLPTQRNDVLAAITEAGLNPSEFDWQRTSSIITRTGTRRPPYGVPLLKHTPTGATFSFDVHAARGHHYAIFFPGQEGPAENINATVWGQELYYVRQWLGYVKREYEAPDLWAELQQRRELIAGDPREPENTLFKPEEKSQIAIQLREISEFVRRTYDLPAAQQAALDARLEYLEDAATRGLGRIDWRNAFVGVMMGVVVEAILPPEVAREVLALALRGLAHLFGLPTLPGGG